MLRITILDGNGQSIDFADDADDDMSMFMNDFNTFKTQSNSFEFYHCV